MKKILIALFISTIFSFFSCSLQNKQGPPVITATLQHECIHRLTNVIVYDIFSPPVAGRIYAYCNLAYYEALRFKDSSSLSITKKLKGFGKMPAPEKNTAYNFSLAAAKAFYTVAKSLTFSKDSLIKSEQVLLLNFKNSMDEKEYNNSSAFGDSIAATILKRSTLDNYKKTRGMPKYNVFNNQIGKWQQTPPDYLDAVEPNWILIQPMLLDSAAQFAPPPPPVYSLNNGSEYHKQVLELITLTKNLTALQNTIAMYWDDNAFVTRHEGHMTYANKKTTPPGHWMGIISIVTQQNKMNEVAVARAFAITACAMFDGFITCWHEKYKSRTIRPITVIQENIQSDWEPILQTPPFPEYISGHSVISSAASTILTKIVGNNFTFTDTTELEYLGLQRSFKSFDEAATEVGLSRMYGGIHFRAAIEQGKVQGKKIAELYLQHF